MLGGLRLCLEVLQRKRRAKVLWKVSEVILRALKQLADNQITQPREPCKGWWNSAYIGRDPGDDEPSNDRL